MVKVAGLVTPRMVISQARTRARPVERDLAALKVMVSFATLKVLALQMLVEHPRRC
jgi:hypothetical protein